MERESEGSPLQVTHTFSVNYGFSWDIVANGKRFSSTCDFSPTMPQLVSSVQDVLIVIGFLNSLVPWHGNNDKMFLPLGEYRKRSFLNASGK